MRMRLWAVAAAGALGSTLAMLATQPAAAVEAIGAKDAAAKVDSGRAVLIDVREAAEVRAGKAAPALWLPTSEIKGHSARYDKVMAGLDPKKEVIVYCASGGRAGAFAAELEKRGFKTGNMGGFSAWQEAGLPVAKP